MLDDLAVLKEWTGRKQAEEKRSQVHTRIVFTFAERLLRLSFATERTGFGMPAVCLSRCSEGNQVWLKEAWFAGLISIEGLYVALMLLMSIPNQCGSPSKNHDWPLPVLTCRRIWNPAICTVNAAHCGYTWVTHSIFFFLSHYYCHALVKVLVTFSFHNLITTIAVQSSLSFGFLNVGFLNMVCWLFLFMSV